MNFNDSSTNDWKDFEKVISHLVLEDKIFDAMNKIYNDSHSFQYDHNSVLSCIARYFENYRLVNMHLKTFCTTYFDFLEKAVSEFEEQLRKYLLRIDKDLNVYVHKELLLNELRGKYEKTVVMDFNYTKLPFDISKHPVNYIHGRLAIRCIVGIDPYYKFPGKNDLYKTLESKIRFTKVYKRLQFMNSQEIRQSVLNKSINRITFFGHSLGEQDYSYFQSIFDYFDLYNSDIFLVFCYTEHDEKPTLTESDRTTQRVFNLINRYGETLSNKDHGNNLLNKLLLEGRLVFYQILQEDVFNEDDVKKLTKEYEEKVK